MTNTLYLKLSKELLEQNITAGTLVHEAGSEKRSTVEPVRSIIDNGLGYISLVQEGRNGPTRSDVVRLDTTLAEVPKIPGISTTSSLLSLLNL